ncbi:riboflavin synthase [Dietzia timorensis]|uniref:Riboflavin synthase n=1 Tax=Dietzia timorensis TaxID=499555 RepID=A0A173LJI8_9ACTN|nr:riboflavin synthase [Dietzia timorensis]ANI92486.1 Riboflavin synthase [Dietzia timorensis]
MFTGIIRQIGEVTSIETDADIVRMRISGAEVLGDASLGDSIATSGVCLTITELPGDGSFVTELMGETMERSAMSQVQVGSQVNLEPAAQLHSRLDGHIVQGHIDGTGTLVHRSSGDKWDVLRFSIPAELAPLVVEKGSIAVSGVSLTVSAVSPADSDEHWFEVSLIPVTLADTTLGQLRDGDAVNLETDVVAKHIARLTEFSTNARQT